MAADVFRVYQDEETMLKVYNRRLGLADAKYDKTEEDRKRFMRRYRNEMEPDQVTTRGHVVSSTGGIGTIDTLYSSMVAVDIDFLARAVGHGTDLQALVASRALNAGWRDAHGQKRARKAIKDSLLVDIGWVKVYYDYQEDVELRDRPKAAMEAEVYTALLDPEDDRDEAAIRDELSAVEEVPIVVRDRVCIDYVPWQQIRWDPSAKQHEDIRWIAQYSEHPLEEVRQHPVWRDFVLDRYGDKKGKSLLKDLKGTRNSVLTSLNGDYSDLAQLGADEFDDDQRITICEMWDFETGLVTVYPKTNTELVLHQRINPLMFNMDLEERSPFKPLIVREDSENVQGIGDMRVIWTALQEEDEYKRNMAQYIARSIPKIMGPERALTPAAKKALQSTQWGAYVPLKDNVSGNEVVPITPPPLPQATYDVLLNIQTEIKEATGANEVARGVFPSRRTTATEASLVSEGGDRRQAERRLKLEEWYLSIARTMLQLMQVFYDTDRVMRYTDDLGETVTWDWTREDIALEADLDIALTPKENMTREERVQRMFTAVNLAFPTEEADRYSILQMMFREMGYREDEIRRMVKSPDEVEAEQQKAMVAEQLAVRPQPFGNSPPGLNIAPGGGGG